MKKLLNSFNKFIQQPYPFYANSKQAWLLVISISVFISFFCVVFRPFGLDALQPPAKYWICAGYGLVTFLITAMNMVLLPIMFRSMLNEKVWKVYKEVLWVFWMTTTIATGNYFYSGLFFDFDPSWDLFFMVQRSTAVIALMPAIGVIFFKQIYMYKKFIVEAKKINEQIASHTHESAEQADLISIGSENEKECVKIRLEQLLYISSTGNYIEVFYQDDQEIRKELFRNRISRIYKELEGLNGIFRCHRTHIVNLHHVSGVQGNSQGYKLQLRNIDEVIPVARTHSKQIRLLLS